MNILCLYIFFQLIMNVWRSCYTISQIVDLGFNFGLNPPPTHIGDRILEFWWFFFFFAIFAIFGIDILFYTLIVLKCKMVGGLKKKHFSVVQPNLKPNLIKDSSWPHHILHLYTRHYFPYNCFCNLDQLFMGMTKSQVKFIIMKNVLLKISKVQIGTIGTLDGWKVRFNVFDLYTFWNELHYNSNF